MHQYDPEPWNQARALTRISTRCGFPLSVAPCIANNAETPNPLFQAIPSSGELGSVAMVESLLGRAKEKRCCCCTCSEMQLCVFCEPFQQPFKATITKERERPGTSVLKLICCIVFPFYKAGKRPHTGFLKKNQLSLAFALCCTDSYFLLWGKWMAR